MSIFCAIAVNMNFLSGLMSIMSVINSDLRPPRVRRDVVLGVIIIIIKARHPSLKKVVQLEEKQSKTFSCELKKTDDPLIDPLN